MRLALLFLASAVIGAASSWALLAPEPAAACTCAPTATISMLARADGTSGPPMCLITQPNEWPLVVACDASFFFYDEAFGTRQ